MNRSQRVAMFAGSFPVISETFILRQITGLLDLGNDVRIFADSKVDAAAVIHPEVTAYRLLERTTYMEMASETAPWEMPVWPVIGRTWPPGSEKSIPNAVRIARGAPGFFRCLIRHPKLALSVVKPAEYGYQASSLSVLHRLAKLSSESKPFNVLHAHFGPVGNSFRFARELWGAPLVVSFHGYDFSTLPRKRGAGIYRRLFETADAITVNSEYTRRRVEELGCPPVKLHRLPVGLRLDDFSFRERVLKPGEPVRILTVGRLVQIKGHEHVIRAVDKLRKRYPALRYEIVGDGPLRTELEKLIEQCGLREIVTLHGAKDSYEVGRMMADAHLFVLASVSVEGDQEGQGLVLQEAQASGLPVVATLHGGFPEGVLADKSGFLVPERDVEALAERLAFLMEHPETWAAMGRQGRTFVEGRYDIARLNRQLLDIYARATEHYQHTSR